VARPARDVLHVPFMWTTKPFDGAVVESHLLPGAMAMLAEFAAPPAQQMAAGVLSRVSNFRSPGGGMLLYSARDNNVMIEYIKSFRFYVYKKRNSFLCTPI